MGSRTALVTGATGLLGRQVVQAFEKREWNVKGTGFSRADNVSVFKVDLGDAAEVQKVIDDTNPQVVVHCAAQRFPEKVDKDPEASKALNVEATRSLAKLCADRSILLIYISTDYVFSGKEGEAPYDTDAQTGPTNLYGQTKLDGELALLDEYKKAGKEALGVVLRVPVLYGQADTPAESATNVLLDTLWKSQEGAKVKMDHWSIRYPTNTEDVGRVAHGREQDPPRRAALTTNVQPADIAVKYLDTEDTSALPRILQFSSEDKMTKYEIVQTFADIMGLSMDNVEPNTEGNDPNASVQRPYDCHLSTKALQDLGIEHVLAIKSQQKNSVFLNTENFIHFLSTDDTTAARKLHKSVQEWRSWYLVNKKVDLAKKEKALQTNHDRLHVEKPTDIVKSGHHRLKVSVDETPYTIGKFEPLLDMNRFDKPLEEFGKDFLPERPAEKQRPPVQRTTARPTTATRQAIATSNDAPATVEGGALPNLSQKSLFLALYAKVMSGEKRKNEDSEMVMGPQDLGTVVNKQLLPVGRFLSRWFEQRTTEDGDLIGSQGWLEYLYGMVLAKEKNEDKAMEYFIRSVHLFPMNWGCWLEMTSLITRLEDLNRVSRHLPQNIISFIFHLHTSLELYQQGPSLANSLDQLLGIFPTSAFLLTCNALLA
ncbi:hypothetical protein BN1723_001159 [Verticillium longisporum]|uniref:Uncharacterized protein n=1 Tax=Verticillium longisporum TaxID=100787 RepID=A0A0G4NKB1_VERLO|nr:hypothetical protein BN1723_001159 [Verticillium longisporum]